MKAWLTAIFNIGFVDILVAILYYGIVWNRRISMGHIFVSYSRRDTKMVDRITGELEDSGLDVWLDRENIKAGNT